MKNIYLLRTGEDVRLLMNSKDRFPPDYIITQHPERVPAVIARTTIVLPADSANETAETLRSKGVSSKDRLIGADAWFVQSVRKQLDSEAQSGSPDLGYAGQPGWATSSATNDASTSDTAYSNLRYAGMNEHPLRDESSHFVSLMSPAVAEDRPLLGRDLASIMIEPTRDALVSALQFPYNELSGENYRSFSKTVSVITGIPVGAVELLLTYETGISSSTPEKKFTSSMMGGYNKHYAGPFQIGRDFWRRGVTLANRLGVKVSNARSRASMAEQVVVWWLVMWADISRFAPVPYHPFTIYTIHNLGMGSYLYLTGRSRNMSRTKMRKYLNAQGGALKKQYAKVYPIARELLYV